MITELDYIIKDTPSIYRYGTRFGYPIVYNSRGDLRLLDGSERYVYINGFYTL